MCVVSNIGDRVGTSPWSDGVKDMAWPYVKDKVLPVIDLPLPPPPPTDASLSSGSIPLQIREVREWLHKLDIILIAAKAFDEATGQPDCEVAGKMKDIKKLASTFGVKMKFFN